MKNCKMVQVFSKCQRTCVVTGMVLLLGWCMLQAGIAQASMMTDLELLSTMDNLTLGTPGICPDDTGNGYDGDLYGSAQINDPTRGNVLGTTVATDGVKYGDVLDAGTQGFTVACWMKIPDTDSTITLANKGMETSSIQTGWRMVSSSTDYFHVWANYGTSTATRLGVKTTYVPDDAWHHFAFVIDQTNGVLKAYLDGNPSSDSAGNFNSGWMLSGTTGYANTFTPGADFSNSNSLNIAFPGSSATVGNFDDFAVWSRALSDTEVAYLAAGNSIPEPSILVLLTGMMAVVFLRRSR